MSDHTSGDTGEQVCPFSTTGTGAPAASDRNSLTVGPDGPILLHDHHFLEQMAHFNRERIPERNVHAKGSGAFGTLEITEDISRYTKAAALQPGVKTPMLARFSTVAGEQGAADAERDVRGFAVKMYTKQGNWDIVGNNIPVFFIQDGIKFPDIIHAGKPHPDREIPQAQSAHDTFWDFVSLHTEAQHHTIWNMSDRGIPRSYRMMEGFGVHTFRVTNAEGATSLVKFHWKPKLGVHSLTWEEAQMLGGLDPDFHRRDLADAIEAGAFPEWEMGVQVFPDTEDQTFHGIDLLDPTKLVPEEIAPVQPIGKMVLDRNPTNYFAETEQVAFHTGHLVPGIDVTDDPLLQARNFSYLDTQLSRLGGPNFNQLPINRPHAPVNDMLRDGMHQHAVHPGVAPYRPNSLDGGCPFSLENQGEDLSDEQKRAFVDAAASIEASRKVRANPASYDDHFSQVRLFWLSLSPVEKEHVVRAYTFELGKCYEQAIKERQLQALANVDEDLCARPALSQVGETWPTDGRIVGLVVDATTPADQVQPVRDAIFGAGLVPFVVGPRGGEIDGVPVQRTFATGRSVELDAVLLLAAPVPAPDALGARDEKAAGEGAVDPRVRLLVEECFRHSKAVGATSAGQSVLEAAGVDPQSVGVVVGDDPTSAWDQLSALLPAHRAWDRFPATLA